ncbi:hypothetical protein ACIRPN_17770 [Streptomyces sp. NPDC101230]
MVGRLGRRDLALIVCAGFVSALAAKAVDAALELGIWVFHALT